MSASGSNQTVQAPTYFTITEFGRAIHVHPTTIRQWDRDGILKPHHRMPGGKRLYTQEQIDQYLSGAVTSGS